MRVILTLTIILIPIIGLTAIDSLSISDKTILEIKDGKEIFGNQSDWWDKYSSGLIAMLTIFISLGISVWQARKTTRENRANSISEARIQWITELRPLLSKLISITSIISNHMSDLSKYIDPKTKKQRSNLSGDKEREMEIIKEKVLSLVEDLAHTYNQCKLFLNKDEPEHAAVISAVDIFLENAIKKMTNKSEVENSISEDDLIEKAQMVLKTAWEQAKNQA